MKVKGLRVDPGYLFNASTTDAIAKKVVADCKKLNVNTIFLMAFSPFYGAYYYTPWAGSWPQVDFGSTVEKNFIGKLLPAAHAAGLSVVASFRMNLYEKIPGVSTDWNVLRKDHAPYTVPLDGTHSTVQRCAWHPKFRTWFSQLLNDFVSLYPAIDGLEACEGSVAQAFESGVTEPDYNAFALADFQRKHPGANPSETVWKRHRSEGLIGLHEILLHATRRLPKAKAYVIHDLVTSPFDAAPLMDPDVYADFCGFDWRGIASLGYDFLVQGAIWQQREQNARALGSPPGKFAPQWTGAAVKHFGTLMTSLSAARMAHVEVTPFPPVTPTPAQFADALKLAFNGSQGTTVYSYHQLYDSHGAENAYAAVLKEIYA